MKQLIGVDVGGTSLRAVRIDTAGHVFQHHRIATAAADGPDVVIVQITSLVEQVMGDADHDAIVGVGVGLPGAVDLAEGIVLQAPNLHDWVNIPLRTILQERTGLRVEINNDGNVAALGEWHFGSGRGCQDFIYVGLGTGIGGGIIVNGQLLLGRKGMAGEVGHMQIEAGGPLCKCGQRGCWEALASGTAMAGFAAQALQNGTPSILHDQAAQGPVTAAEIYAAAAQGDALALALCQREGEYLGRGLVNLNHLFAPECIALGGGVAQGLAWLEPHIQRVITTRAMPPFRDVTVVGAHLGDRAGVIGAAALLIAPVLR